MNQFQLYILDQRKIIFLELKANMTHPEKMLFNEAVNAPKKLSRSRISESFIVKHRDIQNMSKKYDTLVETIYDLLQLDGAHYLSTAISREGNDEIDAYPTSKETKILDRLTHIMDIISEYKKTPHFQNDITIPTVAEDSPWYHPRQQVEAFKRCLSELFGVEYNAEDHSISEEKGHNTEHSKNNSNAAFTRLSQLSNEKPLKLARGSTKHHTRAFGIHEIGAIMSTAITSKLSHDADVKTKRKPKKPIEYFLKHYFIRTFGLKSLAESNYEKFEQSVQSLAVSNTRIQIYCWLIGSDLCKNFVSHDACEFFLQMVCLIIVHHLPPEVRDLKFAESMKQGWGLFIGDGLDQSKKISMAKATMVAKTLYAPHSVVRRETEESGWSRSQDLNPYLRQLRMMSHHNGHSIGSSSLPLETFLLHMMEAWYTNIEDRIANLSRAFSAADTDKDGTMSLSEFKAFMLHQDADLDDAELMDMYVSWSGSDNVIHEPSFINYMLQRHGTIRYYHT